MDTTKAERIANELIRRHLELSMFWSFRYSNAKRYFGCCRYKILVFKGGELTIPGGEIILSRPLTALNSRAQVVDTLLHEISHAICGPGIGHSKAWKETAKKLGCRPERCCDTTKLILPPPRYIAECPNCGRQKGFERVRSISCSKCDNEKYNPAYRMVFRRNPNALQSSPGGTCDNAG